MFQVGGVGFALAWLMQRWGPFIVLSVSYLLTAIALALLGVQIPGAALGMGRFGGILAPLAAGQLMSAGVAIGHLFWLAIIPALICAGGVGLLRTAVSRSQVMALAA